MVSIGDGEARLDMAQGVCDGADSVTELSGLPGIATDGINFEGDGLTTLPPLPLMSPWDLLLASSAAAADDPGCGILGSANSSPPRSCFCSA